MSDITRRTCCNITAATQHELSFSGTEDEFFFCGCYPSSGGHYTVTSGTVTATTLTPRKRFVIHRKLQINLTAKRGVPTCYEPTPTVRPATVGGRDITNIYNSQTPIRVPVPPDSPKLTQEQEVRVIINQLLPLHYYLST